MAFDELHSRSPRKLELRHVLREEVKAGRVRRVGDRLELVPQKFEPDLLTALAAVEF